VKKFNMEDKLRTRQEMPGSAHRRRDDLWLLRLETCYEVQKQQASGEKGETVRLTPSGAGRYEARLPAKGEIGGDMDARPPLC